MMQKTGFTSVFFICIFFTIFHSILSAADSGQIDQELKENAPQVYLDCRGCDRDFMRTEITFVNYVRDRYDADIYILVTEQGTGSGGQEYTLAFMGRNDFEGIEHTLTFSTLPTDTWDEQRKEMAEVLKKGLFPYILNSPIADHCTVNFKRKLKPTAVNDKWNFWVFSASLDGRFSGESSQRSRSFDVNFSANRVTPDWKIRLGLSGDFDEREYEYDNAWTTSTSEEKDITGMIVKSLNKHWSVGGWLEAESSAYGNLDSQFTIAPALEFNLFPYSESTRRQLRFLYRVGLKRANYIEETIYGKNSETLYNQSLTATLEIREPWGSTSTSIEGAHYFHDISKYRFELRGFVSFRIIKGFSVDVWGRYERKHDQLALPVGDASLDEILLRRRELATDYDYSISVGLRYTFGSVYSNVVNPRFGGTSRRGRWR